EAATLAAAAVTIGLTIAADSLVAGNDAGRHGEGRSGHIRQAASRGVGAVATTSPPAADGLVVRDRAITHRRRDPNGRLRRIVIARRKPPAIYPSHECAAR